MVQLSWGSRRKRDLPTAGRFIELNTFKSSCASAPPLL